MGAKRSACLQLPHRLHSGKKNQLRYRFGVRTYSSIFAKNKFGYKKKNAMLKNGPKADVTEKPVNQQILDALDKSLSK